MHGSLYSLHVQSTWKVHTETNCCQMLGKDFDQIFNQVFDQNFGMMFD